MQKLPPLVSGWIGDVRHRSFAAVMKRVFTWFLVSFLALMAGSVQALSVRFIRSHPVEIFNQHLDPSVPTVDLRVHLVEGAGFSWQEMRKQIFTAKWAFRLAGVQIRVLSVEEISIPSGWKKIVGVVPSADRRSLVHGLDFYEDVEQKKYVLSDEAKRLFSAVIGTATSNPKTIHVITLSRVRFDFFEYEGKSWERNSLYVGALSFPPYQLQNRLDHMHRGVITMQKARRDLTLAHEIGHKLMNVSHEGLSKCPRFSGRSVPGLMGYGKDYQIHQGENGRWHRERLYLSPFLYRIQGGAKVWNPDYQRNGRYDDPIYGDAVILPACS